jgi:4-hydroxythreonine-4-phosphate dehydrogenase
MWLNRTSLKLPDFIVIGPRLPFADLNGFPLEEISSTGEIQPGHPNAASATAAADALRRAANMALSGAISAVATAPVHKTSLYDIGFTFPGQTEFFADACGIDSEDTAMMLAGPSLRTVPLTIHIALRDVFSALTADLIVRQATLVRRALQQDFGIASPRLALAGLNPHAGEGGHIGTEEQAVMQPAVETLSRNGVIISGPLPADTLFSADKRNLYDAVLCPYHDQALIPVKTLDLDNTVNVTLGLPIVRTSPDHGTAHDIAGKGIAKPDSMIAALRLAAQIVSHRNMHG